MRVSVPLALCLLLAAPSAHADPPASLRAWVGILPGGGNYRDLTTGGLSYLVAAELKTRVRKDVPNGPADMARFVGSWVLL